MHTRHTRHTKDHTGPPHETEAHGRVGRTTEHLLDCCLAQALHFFLAQLPTTCVVNRRQRRDESQFAAFAKKRVWGWTVRRTSPICTVSASGSSFRARSFSTNTEPPGKTCSQKRAQSSDLVISALGSAKSESHITALPSEPSGSRPTLQEAHQGQIRSCRWLPTAWRGRLCSSKHYCASSRAAQVAKSVAQACVRCAGFLSASALLVTSQPCAQAS
jgi:hypothetical protein